MRSTDQYIRTSISFSALAEPLWTACVPGCDGEDDERASKNGEHHGLTESVSSNIYFHEGVPSLSAFFHFRESCWVSKHVEILLLLLQPLVMKSNRGKGYLFSKLSGIGLCNS